MTANNGWPGKPGVPLHPEKDGWHWVSGDGGDPEPFYWNGIWQGSDQFSYYSLGESCCYFGPCLTPDEAAALQARCEEAERERDALRRDASQQVTTDEMVRRLQHLGDWKAADRIEALQKRVAELEATLRDLLPEAINDRYMTQSAAVERARAALTGGKDE